MNFQSLLPVEAIILGHTLPINKMPYYFQATHCHIKPSVEGRICPRVHSKSPELYFNWTGSSTHPWNKLTGQIMTASSQWMSLALKYIEVTQFKPQGWEMAEWRASSPYEYQETFASTFLWGARLPVCLILDNWSITE